MKPFMHLFKERSRDMLHSEADYPNVKSVGTREGQAKERFAPEHVDHLHR